MATGSMHDMPMPLDYAVLSAVTVIDTETNEVIGTTGPIYAKDMEIAVDGRVYAIDEDYYYADVNVYDKDMRYLELHPPHLACRLAVVSRRRHSRSALTASTPSRTCTTGTAGGMTVSIIDTDPAEPDLQ